MLHLFNYQLDLVTPGTIPSFASALKHILHILNFLRYAFGLPQRGHLLYALTLNFGFLSAFMRILFFANLSSYDSWLAVKRHMELLQQKFCILIIFGRGNYGDVKTFRLLNLVKVDLRENKEFLYSYCIVSSAVKRFA